MNVYNINVSFTKTYKYFFFIISEHTQFLSQPSNF